MKKVTALYTGSDPVVIDAKSELASHTCSSCGHITVANVREDNSKPFCVQCGESNTETASVGDSIKGQMLLTAGVEQLADIECGACSSHIVMTEADMAEHADEDGEGGSLFCPDCGQHIFWDNAAVDDDTAEADNDSADEADEKDNGQEASSSDDASGESEEGASDKDDFFDGDSSDEVAGEADNSDLEDDKTDENAAGAADNSEENDDQGEEENAAGEEESTADGESEEAGGESESDTGDGGTQANSEEAGEHDDSDDSEEEDESDDDDSEEEDDSDDDNGEPESEEESTADADTDTTTQRKPGGGRYRVDTGKAGNYMRMSSNACEMGLSGCDEHAMGRVEKVLARYPRLKIRKRPMVRAGNMTMSVTGRKSHEFAEALRREFGNIFEYASDDDGSSSVDKGGAADTSDTADTDDVRAGADTGEQEEQEEKAKPEETSYAIDVASVDDGIEFAASKSGLYVMAGGTCIASLKTDRDTAELEQVVTDELAKDDAVLSDVLVRAGFELAEVAVFADKAIVKQKERLEAEAHSAVQKETSALDKVVEHSLGIAAAGINRGLFDVDNPLADSLSKELVEHGLSEEYASALLSRVFDESGDEYVRVVREKTMELAARSDESRNDLAAMIKKGLRHRVPEIASNDSDKPSPDKDTVLALAGNPGAARGAMPRLTATLNPRRKREQAEADLEVDNPMKPSTRKSTETAATRRGTQLPRRGSVVARLAERSSILTNGVA